MKAHWHHTSTSNPFENLRQMWTAAQATLRPPYPQERFLVQMRLVGRRARSGLVWRAENTLSTTGSNPEPSSLQHVMASHQVICHDTANCMKQNFIETASVACLVKLFVVLHGTRRAPSKEGRHFDSHSSESF